MHHCYVIDNVWSSFKRLYASYPLCKKYSTLLKEKDPPSSIRVGPERSNSFMKYWRDLTFLSDPWSVFSTLNQTYEKGKLPENAVFLHLQRGKAQLSNPDQINCWKGYCWNDVDFVIRNSRTVNTLVNLNNASSIDKINAREIMAFFNSIHRTTVQEL